VQHLGEPGRAHAGRWRPWHQPGEPAHHLGPEPGDPGVPRGARLRRRQERRHRRLPVAGAERRLSPRRAGSRQAAHPGPGQGQAGEVLVGQLRRAAPATTGQGGFQASPGGCQVHVLRAVQRVGGVQRVPSRIGRIGRLGVDGDPGGDRGPEQIRLDDQSVPGRAVVEGDDQHLAVTEHVVAPPGRHRGGPPDRHRPRRRVVPGLGHRAQRRGRGCALGRRPDRDERPQGCGRGGRRGLPEFLGQDARHGRLAQPRVQAPTTGLGEQCRRLHFHLQRVLQLQERLTPCQEHLAQRGHGAVEPLGVIESTAVEPGEQVVLPGAPPTRRTAPAATSSTHSGEATPRRSPPSVDPNR
jgi:hypothetical protein